MSIRKMAEVWDLVLPHGKKLVLLSLADQANDAGICWPSLATIQRRCGYSERGLRDILADLEQQGLIRRQLRDGRATVYTVTPAGTAGVGEKTPATAAGVPPADPGNGCPPPRQSLPGTPAATAAPPGNGCPQNPKEPSKNPQGTEEARARSGRAIGMPEGVNEEALGLWCEWLGRKGKPTNDIQRPLLASQLVLFGDAARQLEVVQHSIRRGWVSLHPPRDEAPAAEPYQRKTADELEAEAIARGEDPNAFR